MSKIELPLSCDREVAELVAAFEACSLPVESWTHRAHLAVGAYYARRLDYPAALQHMRGCIQRYNLSQNNPTGYNETITRLFLAKMISDQQAGLACENLADEIVRLAGVCNLAWLYSFYSPSLIHSDLAKKQWVPPDGQPLDFEMSRQ